MPTNTSNLVSFAPKPCLMRSHDNETVNKACCVRLWQIRKNPYLKGVAGGGERHEVPRYEPWVRIPLSPPLLN